MKSFSQEDLPHLPQACLSRLPGGKGRADRRLACGASGSPAWSKVL